MGGPHGIVISALDCDIIVSEFEHQSDYYVVHFQTNTLRKGMNSLTDNPQAIGYPTNMVLALNNPRRLI